ncbi:uncharacterized protein ACLA_013820 [Aspergillus clavatus NRRL 1]|uniref:Tetraspanin Tsp3 n=1 Tax=Aspergillus clavatus (strain ATCC 1007 / CBS 513.65 / DSM 816 / NCTC 3887 / NRRL 1 / QM 1276 / 107) TaxID=344612 RepID=A1CB27_ASPCL|nr:uncharacterized protein ACLA_013820 [Aspergillus clavatus NRRL 1]EAW12945.1 hypothetical protein ACLA_013820 [Aspergillus clavatus NRRL 1]
MAIKIKAMPVILVCLFLCSALALILGAPNSYRNAILMVMDQIHSVVATVIATIALTYLFPGDILSCRLEKQWQSYFQHKDAQAIRAIQDRFQCCGFRSTHDRAWPFKDRNHGDNACETQLGYQRSCYSPWQGQYQSASWMVFAAAALIWVMKIGFVHFNRPRPSWMSTAPSREAGSYQRITDSGLENEGHTDQGVRVQAATGFPPSNEWE